MIPDWMYKKAEKQKGVPLSRVPGYGTDRFISEEAPLELGRYLQALCEQALLAFDELEAKKEEVNYSKVATLFSQLSSEERIEIVSNYCKGCWDKDPKCQCWNDE